MTLGVFVFSAVPEVVEAVAQVSPPVLVAPMRDLLISEGHPAQFQCSVSGEGIASFTVIQHFKYSLTINPLAAVINVP